MKEFSELTASDVQTYLSKGWLTHDSMWLFNAYNLVGIEKGNELNRGAIKSMAFLEMKRTKEIFGYNKKPSNIDELYRFLQSALRLLMPSELFKSFSVTIGGPSIIEWQWEKGACFAYKGMKMIQMIDQYHCGVIYRIECWFEELGLNYDVNPKIKKCVMNSSGSCTGEFKILF